MLRTNLVDYLENHLANRLEQTRLDMRMVGMEDSAQKPKNTVSGSDKPVSEDPGAEKELFFEKMRSTKKAPRLLPLPKPRNWKCFCVNF